MNQMQISYKIINVDKENESMIIEYTKDGQVITIETAIPLQVEDLDRYVYERTPGEWLNQVSEKFTIQDIKENTSGTITLDNKMIQDIPRIVSDTYSDAPELVPWIAKTLEDKSYESFRLQRFHDKNSKAKALMIQHGAESLTKNLEEFLTHAKQAIADAKSYGVPVYMYSRKSNYDERINTELGLTVDHYSLFWIAYIPWTNDMNAKRLQGLGEAVRKQRNDLLLETDWIHLPDTTKPANIAEWETYRQALRDITGQSGFPQNIQWPQKPA